MDRSMRQAITTALPGIGDLLLQPQNAAHAFEMQAPQTVLNQAELF